MPAWQAWSFWSVAALLAVAGVWLVIRGLFGDRARGRRRCPKCWYDLSHTPGSLCSECGYTTQYEKRFCRTRRRWRMALLGTLILLAAVPAGIWPTVREHGWGHIVPTTVLIYTIAPEDIEYYGLMPSIPSPTGRDNEFAEALVSRIHRNRLWNWQLNVVIDRCLGGDWPLNAIKTQYQRAWPLDQPFWASATVVHSPAAESLMLDAYTRVRLQPRFDPDVQPVIVNATNAAGALTRPTGFDPLRNWSQAQRWGTVREAGEFLHFDVIVERNHAIFASPAPRQARVPPNSGWVDASMFFGPMGEAQPNPTWTVLRRSELTLPVHAANTLDDFIDVDRSAETTQALQKELLARVDNAGAMVRLHADVVGKPIPVSITLLRDDKPVNSWDTLLHSPSTGGFSSSWYADDNGPSRTIQTWPTQLTFRTDLNGHDRPSAAAESQAERWSLRIRGNPSFAILARGASSPMPDPFLGFSPSAALAEPTPLHAWEGDFTLPLSINESASRRFLVPSNSGRDMD